MTENNSPLERLLDWCAGQVASLRLCHQIPSTGEIDDVATLQEIEQVEADIDAVRRALAAPTTVPVPEDIRGLPDEWRSKARMSRSHADNLDGMDAENAVCASRADAHDEDADELEAALAHHSDPENDDDS